MLIQQGDILIESVCNMPEGNDVLPKNGRYILAEGEVTGHAHAISDIAGIKFIEKDGMFYLQNKNSVKVKHEEHKHVTIPPGIWKVRKVREYDHFAEEARAVAD